MGIYWLSFSFLCYISLLFSVWLFCDSLQLTRYMAANRHRGLIQACAWGADKVGGQPWTMLVCCQIGSPGVKLEQLIKRKMMSTGLCIWTTVSMLTVIVGFDGTVESLPGSRGPNYLIVYTEVKALVMLVNLMISCLWNVIWYMYGINGKHISLWINIFTEKSDVWNTASWICWMEVAPFRNYIRHKIQPLHSPSHCTLACLSHFAVLDVFTHLLCCWLSCGCLSYIIYGSVHRSGTLAEH